MEIFKALKSSQLSCVWWLMNARLSWSRLTDKSLAFIIDCNGEKESVLAMHTRYFVSYFKMYLSRRPWGEWRFRSWDWARTAALSFSVPLRGSSPSASRCSQSRLCRLSRAGPSRRPKEEESEVHSQQTRDAEAGWCRLKHEIQFWRVAKNFRSWKGGNFYVLGPRNQQSWPDL